MNDRNPQFSTGGITLEGSAVGSALITGNGNVVTIVYGANVIRPQRRIEANPYRGLAAFDEASSRLFFGRENIVSGLLDRIAFLTSPGKAPDTIRLLAIMGPQVVARAQ